MTTAAIPAAIKLSKSISVFGACGVPGLCSEADPAAGFSFRLAIGVKRSVRQAAPSRPSNLHFKKDIHNNRRLSSRAAAGLRVCEQKSRFTDPAKAVKSLEQPTRK
jgi:hypothetical protein